MKGQWGLILGLLAAIVIAIFAVINVDGVRVNYLFGTAEWPLILVILGSVFMGAVIAGALGMVRIYQLRSELRRLKTADGLAASRKHDNTGADDSNLNKDEGGSSPNKVFVQSNAEVDQEKRPTD